MPLGENAVTNLVEAGFVEIDFREDAQHSVQFFWMWSKENGTHYIVMEYGGVQRVIYITRDGITAHEVFDHPWFKVQPPESVYAR